jgi:hypothetical membrane protein
VKPIPWWALASSAAAPLILGGGLAISQARQPSAYDAFRDTISALAAHGATDRWVMTSALAGLGGCHIITAAGLRPARNAGRFVLAGGGIATVLVAVFAQPARGNSVAHTVAAALAFIALGVWPTFSAHPESRAPLLRCSSTVAASVAMLGLVGWFVLEVHGGQRGLSERAAAGAQALWPLAVVLTTRRFAGRAES